ncbi:hypothetical protein CKM354_000756900 [Cercospora kikuchii]|uniref:Uncharacterized protein n=1 Tax=Cercospora kikuchii TaxID=84275 RepID=A0A9P3FEF6_9PEZI|nr:uncharacterized protein CKM354_000756900 [Cercospora kikuchii]GIZ44371.1 hypothetical protein CKM354_000756900 [Cercospora kikuchii]
MSAIVGVAFSRAHNGAGILLASVLGDREAANECLIKAQSVWRIVRRWHPVGEDEAVDASLKDLRVPLDKLKEALAADKPTGSDPDTAVVDQVTVRDAVVDEERGQQRTR